MTPGAELLLAVVAALVLGNFALLLLVLWAFGGAAWSLIGSIAAAALAITALVEGIRRFVRARRRAP